jgi:hypothetical protein
MLYPSLIHSLSNHSPHPPCLLAIMRQWTFNNQTIASIMMHTKPIAQTNMHLFLGQHVPFRSVNQMTPWPINCSPWMLSCSHSSCKMLLLLKLLQVTLRYNMFPHTASSCNIHSKKPQDIPLSTKPSTKPKTPITSSGRSIRIQQKGTHHMGTVQYRTTSLLCSLPGKEPAQDSQMLSYLHMG